MSVNDDLYQALQESREIIEAQNEELERIAAQSLLNAIVIKTDTEVTTVAINGQARTMPTPRTIGVSLSLGDPVLITPDSFQFIKKADYAPQAGEIVSVTKIISDTLLEVSIRGSEHVVLCSEDFVSVIKVGTRALVDPSKMVLLSVIETPTSTFERTVDTGVVWNDIGGQEEAKQHLIEAIEMPLKHPDVFSFYNKKPIKGILLEGPPGCGKTMLAKAAASAVGGIDSMFLYVKGPEILDPYVGVTESTLRSLFQQARSHKEETGIPAVLFIDEAEALLGIRGGHNSMMEKTVVPTFLAEMDGLDESAAIVILATNNASSLDPAVTREGRMDRKVTIKRPTRSEAETIFKLNLRKIPLDYDTDLNEAAASATECIFDTSKKIYELHFDDNTYAYFTFSNLVSGALITGIVDQATSAALRRDISSGKKPRGITLADILTAAENVYRQNINVSHTVPLQEFIGSRTVVNMKGV